MRRREFIWSAFSASVIAVMKVPRTEVTESASGQPRAVIAAEDRCREEFRQRLKRLCEQGYEIRFQIYLAPIDHDHGLRLVIVDTQRGRITWEQPWQ